MFRYWISSQENDKLEAISSARVAAKFHLDLIALTAKIAAADRNSKPWSKAAMKSPGQRRGDGKGRGFHSEVAREGGTRAFAIPV